MPAHPRRDPPVAPDRGHLGHDEPRTADCPGAEVDEVPVVDRSVPGGVLAHGRHAHPVGQGQLAQAKRREERGRRRAGARGRSGAGGLLIPSIPPSPPSDPQRGLVLGDRHAGLGFGLSGHPAIHLVHERGVALPQVLVRNAQTSREEREGELHRLQAEVALGVLEPLKAGLGGTLQRLDRTTALGLVGGQGLGKRPGVGRAGTDPPQRLGQRHAVEHGQARARPHREVRRVGGVADEHDVARRPTRVHDRGKAAPHGPVADQGVALQLIREEPGQEADRLVLASRVHARTPPRRLGGLHNEGGPSRGVVLVGVHPPEAVLGLAEMEGEGGEGPRRAQPDEAVGTQVDRGLERVREMVAHPAVDAVGTDHEVGVQVRPRVGHPRLEVEADAQIAATPMQQHEQRSSRQPGEAVPGRLQTAAPVVDVDVVPVMEPLLDRAQRRGVGVGDLLQRGVREHDAEAEGVVGPVAFEDRDVSRGVVLLEEQRGEEAAGPAPDDVDLQLCASRTSPPPMIRCWISVVPS